MSRSSQHRKPEPITDKNHVLTFGKYKGESIADILETNPQYLVWLHFNSEFFELDASLLEEAEEYATTIESESNFNRRFK